MEANQDRRQVTITAGEIEGWTTGDGDLLNSNLMTVLNDAQEEVSRGGKESAEVLIIITK